MEYFWKKVTKEGESPVHEINLLPNSILSRAGHVKSCLNLPGPSGKTKNSRETDSEQVPWGKGEKYPEQGSEIEPETIRLQAVGAFFKVTACLLHNEPTSYSSLARLRIYDSWPQRKQVRIRRIVRGGRRETKWSTHGQVEAPLIWSGGPNQFTLKSDWMTCG